MSPGVHQRAAAALLGPRELGHVPSSAPAPSPLQLGAAWSPMWGQPWYRWLQHAGLDDLLFVLITNFLHHLLVIGT